MKALSRNTDPESSHIAAARVTRTGKTARDRAKCAQAVALYPGRTSYELHKETGLDRHMLGRRLYECKGIRKGKHLRKDHYTGTPSLTWWPDRSSAKA